MVVEGHEGGVDDNAEGDEKVDERIEHDEGQELCQPDVAVAAVPHTHHLEALRAEVTDPLF